MTGLGPLDELVGAASVVLDELGVTVGNGQIRERPDVRTVRYYTSLGLLDRPAAVRGRTALYRRRHLLQLVAVKALQARGDSLASLQRRLPGCSDSELEHLIGAPVPAEAFAARPQQSAAEPAAPMPAAATSLLVRRRAAAPRFWRVLPEQAPAGTPPARRLVGITLAPGVEVQITTRRDLSATTLNALRTAAGPLLDALHRAALNDAHQEGSQ